MAGDLKISAMKSKTSLTGTEVFPVVLGSINYKATLNQVKDFTNKDLDITYVKAEPGKGLSTNDFTLTDKEKIDAANTAAENANGKAEGLETRVSKLEEGGVSVTVDKEVKPNSENPVSGGAVYDALANKASIDRLATVNGQSLLNGGKDIVISGGNDEGNATEEIVEPPVFKTSSVIDSKTGKVSNLGNEQLAILGPVHLYADDIINVTCLSFSYAAALSIDKGDKHQVVDAGNAVEGTKYSYTAVSECDVYISLKITRPYEVVVVRNNTAKIKGNIKVIDLRNCDRFLISGASFTAGGGRDFRDKGWLCIYSQLSDWTCEGYGQSGDGYIDLYNCIQNNTSRYGTVGIRDFNKTYFLVSIAENDTKYHTFNPSYLWQDIVVKTVRAIKSVGAIPILHTNFGNFASSDIFAILHDIAEKEHCLFWDVSTVGYLFNQNRYLPFWSNGHPGVRTNTLLWSETFKKYLPQPRTGIKIFRNRKTFAYSSEDDLIFSDNVDRMKRWREISIGHGRATEGFEKYYDELNKGKSTTFKQPSEYLMLINNEAVSFEDKMLIQVIVNSTPTFTQNVKLKLATKDVLNCKILKMYDITQAYNMKNVNIEFKTQIGLNIQAGDVYQTNDADFSGINFTVVSYNKDVIICTPSAEITDVPGLFDGTLTKQSGNGEGSVTYNSMTKSIPVEFTDKIGKSMNRWEDVAFTEGVVSIEHPQSYMHYDKLYFLFEKAGKGVFNINDIKVEYSSTEEKPAQPVNVSERRYTKTSELLKSKFDDADIAKWTKEDTITPSAPADSNIPVECGNKVIELANGEEVSRQLTVNFPAGKSKKLHIVVYARRFPEIFDSSKTFHLHDLQGENPICEDSYDFAELEIGISRHTGNVYPTHTFKKIVPLWWAKIEQDIYLTAPEKFDYTFSLKCTDKSVQLAYCKIDLVE